MARWMSGAAFGLRIRRRGLRRKFGWGRADVSGWSAVVVGEDCCRTLLFESHHSSHRSFISLISSHQSSNHLQILNQRSVIMTDVIILFCLL